MIEDALKSTRTLHRLIMGVALATLVFALSIDLPRDKADLKDMVDRLLKVDLTGYAEFAEAEAAREGEAVLTPLGEDMTARLEAAGLPIFQLHHLGEAMAVPQHVGRVMAEDLVWSNMEAATLVDLHAITAALELDRDVQILVPKIDALIDGTAHSDGIIDFLLNNPEAGRQVAEVIAGPDVIDMVGETFLPEGEVVGALQFELRRSAQQEAAPVFFGNYVMDTRAIPGTSFLDWLAMQEVGEDLVSTENGALVFLPGLVEPPAGFEVTPLGELSSKLGEELAASSPSRAAATILGTEVPGALVVYAAPLILVFLSYYLMHHLAHLGRLVAGAKEDYRQFSWLPLSLEWQKSWDTRRGRLTIAGGWLELLASGMLLPLVALLMLYLQLAQFGPVGWRQGTVLAAAAFGISATGARSLLLLAEIRDVLQRPRNRFSPRAS